MNIEILFDQYYYFSPLQKMKTTKFPKPGGT